MIDGTGEQAASSPLPPSRMRFLAIGLLGPLALVLLALWFGLQLNQLDTMRSVVRASYDKRFTVTELMRRLDEAESAQRGYVITGNAAFLGAYDGSHQHSLATLATLRDLYATDPEQSARLARLGALIRAKFGEMTAVIEARSGLGLAVAATQVANPRGVVLMEHTRAMATAMSDAEQASLASRVDFVRSRYQTMRRIVWASMLFAGVALLFALWFVWRAQAAHYRIEQHAHATAARLRAIFASTADAILILDMAGRIRATNVAVGRMLGFAPEELIGRDASTMLGVAEGEGSFHERIGLRGDRLAQPNRLDRTVRHRDGYDVPVDIALGLMVLPDETQIVAALRDISERRRRVGALRT